MKQKIIKVAFMGTQKGYAFNNWLKNKKNIKAIICKDPMDADYIFLYHPQLMLFKDLCFKYQDKILISITGEAIAPDFNLVDYAIAFDPIIYNDRYAKIPLPIVDEKVNGKDELAKKIKFCNFIYSHNGAHPNRDKFFKKLSEYKKVDSLGEHLRNVDKAKPTRRNNNWFKLSIEEKSPYKFSIAFENAESCGYTTEKIYSSMLAKTIPIYWGDPEVSKYYNSNSFVNCNDYKDFDEVIAKVKELDNDDEKYIKMLSEPWQTPEQLKLIEEQYKYLNKMLDVIFLSPYSEAFRKPVGTWALKYKRNLYISNKIKILFKKFRSNFFYIKFRHKEKIIKILGVTLLNINLRNKAIK